jgi:hypothetical protein
MAARSVVTPNAIVGEFKSTASKVPVYWMMCLSEILSSGSTLVDPGDIRMA